MKLFNIAKVALAVIIGSFATSCSDDGYWEDATNGLGSKVTLHESTISQTYVEGTVPASVTATITRGTTEGDQTIALNQKSTKPENFDVPASVTIPNGSRDAQITITLKDMNTPGTYSDVIWIADTASVALGGRQTLTVTITVKADEPPAEWTNIGQAMVREDIISTYFNLNVPFGTWKCPIQEDKLKPGVYRLEDPYGKYCIYLGSEEYNSKETNYMVINAQNPEHVYIEKYETGSDLGYGELVIWSIAGLRLSQGKTEEEVAELGAFGTLKKGIITFPAKQLLVTMLGYNEPGSYNYANNSGKFAIALPGYVLGEYGVGVNYVGRLTDTDNKDFAIADVEFVGKDVAYAHVGIVPTMISSEAVTAVTDSTVEFFTLEKPGSVQFPIEKSGTYTIAVVSYDADGGVQESATSTIKFVCASDLSQDENAGWKSLGNGIYTDNLICSIYKGMEPVSYEVEVQEKEDQPGYYRMVNPYGAAFPYNGEGDYDPNTNYYIEIDATHPNCVMIPLQQTGLDWGDGMVMIYSYAGYYYDNGNSVAEIEAAGLGGKISEGVISFADETILFSMEAIQNGAIMVCPKGFNLVLPTSPVPAPPMLAPKKVSGKNIVNGFIKAALNSNKAVAPVYNREFRAPAGHVVSMF